MSIRIQGVRDVSDLIQDSGSASLPKPREVAQIAVGAPSLEVPKAMDRALGSLSWWECPWQRWELDGL